MRYCCVILLQFRMALVTFADTASTHFYLEDHAGNKLSVINAMRIMYNGGRTNVQEALMTARTQVREDKHINSGSVSMEDWLIKANTMGIVFNGEKT